MTSGGPAPGRLLAISDLHVAYAENREFVAELRPESERRLAARGRRRRRAGRATSSGRCGLLRQRFATWCGRRATTSCGRPGTTRSGCAASARYQHLVEMCRGTRRAHPGGPVPGVARRRRAGHRRAAVPALRLHVPAAGARPRRRAAGQTAYETGVVCTDEFLLHPDPYPSRDAWCAGAGREHRAPAGRAATRPADRAGQPLPAGPRADAGAALPGVRPVVRHRADRRLAPAVPGRRRRLRAPAHPAHAPGTTGCRSRRCRSATRASGAATPARRAGPARSCRPQTWSGRRAIAVLAALPPAGIAAVEAFDDDIPARLFPEEEALVARSVDKRRREFTTARRCAREALARLGVPPAPILPGERGAPRWPAGVVGSMTHCAGYRAAAVARPAPTCGSIGHRRRAARGRCPTACWR